MFQSFGVANSSLAKQLLNFSTIVQRSLHIGDELIRDIDCGAPPLDSDIQDIAGMLFTFQAGLASLTDAGTAAQAEGAESCRPKTRRLISEPLFNIDGRFILSSHDVYVPRYTHTVKSILRNDVIAITYEFRDRN